MSGAIFLNPSKASPWKWDPANSEYYLEIAGTKVAILDADGNMKIKGRFLSF